MQTFLFDCDQSFFTVFSFSPLSLDKNAGFDGQEGITLKIKDHLPEP